MTFTKEQQEFIQVRRGVYTLLGVILSLGAGILCGEAVDASGEGCDGFAFGTFWVVFPSSIAVILRVVDSVLPSPADPNTDRAE